MKKIVILALLAGLALVACAEKQPQPQPIKPDCDIKPQQVVVDQPGYGIFTDFAMGMLSRTEEGNVVVSPVSALYALSMAANGAGGETYVKMLNALALSGLPHDGVYNLPCMPVIMPDEILDNLNRRMYAFGQQEGLHMANGLWLKNRDDLDVKDEFLQKMVDYYSANIYKGDFDQQTVKEINAFVNQHTLGMVPELVKEMSPDTIMALVNAVGFDQEWLTPYEDYQQTDGLFYAYDGSENQASYLHSTERIYISGEGVTGFAKPYKEGYSFVALLPEDDVEQYTRRLTGGAFTALLDSAQRRTVNATMPEFECEYGLEMEEMLTEMGMGIAFDPDNADFTNMATLPGANISISRVLHRAHIQLTAAGTKAGAATIVEMKETMAVMEPEEIPEVVLNRPFVYAIVHDETGIPVFVGKVTEIK